MRTRIVGIVAALALLLPAAAVAQLKAVPHVTGLTSPIAFIQDSSDPANQFVVQQNGRIRLVRNGVVQAPDFLNLATEISTGGERGLLGMALSPDYPTTGRFFVNFTDLNGHTVVARFRRDPSNPLRADPNYRLDLRWSTNERFIHQPFSNHNGGNLAFGPDGYLYIGMGDGGSGNDPENHAQRADSLLGKMLRIDVSVSDGDINGFIVPSDNPFVTSSRPEIWSFGLRNPWRWSFDDVARGGTGALIIADVGQNAFEEINYEPAGRGGRNYGWRIREGLSPTPGIPATTPAFTPLTDPIFDYGRSSGGSVTGGFVYRGSALPAYVGRYFFADFVSGRIWSLRPVVNPTTGEATAADLREHTAELTSGPVNVSTFGVDASGELYFANYAGTIYRIVAAGPTMTVDKSSLAFGAIVVNQAFASRTSAQTIRLTQSGEPGTVTWTVASNSPWLVVSPTSGTGSGAITVSVQHPPGGISPDQSGSITFSFTGAGPVPGPIPVRLRIAFGSSEPPGGAFDTPNDGATGISGSIAVTGWAVDDVDVSRVRIWRDAVAGEAAGTLLLVGDATMVEGARPDVEAAFPTLPRSSRAGWGYLLLTNFLPNLGNGTFRLHAFAEDTDGHSAFLGSKTIVVGNANATAPFGAIDTPDQGGVVSGVVTNFGWVLSRAPRRADPPGGGSVQVLIDGVVTAFVPTGWASRADITALFPVAEYPGVNTAVGHAVFDSATLSNGVHTIAWVVTDNLGNAAGIGSRYFTVSNGSSVVSSQLPAASLRAGPARVVGLRGFDPYAAYETFEPGSDGRITIAIPELGRVELWLGSGTTGHAVTSRGRAALPIGAHLDPDTGRFTWNPGAGFVGTYDFEFNGRNIRITVGDR